MTTGADIAAINPKSSVACEYLRPIGTATTNAPNTAILTPQKYLFILPSKLLKVFQYDQKQAFAINSDMTALSAKPPSALKI
jgi:hypothetical protein